MSQGEAIGTGIIIFSLWYIMIAYNYLRGNLPVDESQLREPTPGRRSQQQSISRKQSKHAQQQSSGPTKKASATKATPSGPQLKKNKPDYPSASKTKVSKPSKPIKLTPVPAATSKAPPPPEYPGAYILDIHDPGPVEESSDSPKPKRVTGMKPAQTIETRTATTLPPEYPAIHKVDIHESEYPEISEKSQEEKKTGKEVQTKPPLPRAPVGPEYPTATNIFIHNFDKVPADVPALPFFKTKPDKPAKPAKAAKPEKSAKPTKHVEVKQSKTKSVSTKIEREPTCFPQQPPLPLPPPPPKSKDYEAVTNEDIHGYGIAQKVSTEELKKSEKSPKKEQTKTTKAAATTVKGPPPPPEYPGAYIIDIHSTAATTTTEKTEPAKEKQPMKPKKATDIDSSKPVTSAPPAYPAVANICIHGNELPGAANILKPLPDIVTEVKKKLKIDTVKASGETSQAPSVKPWSAEYPGAQNIDIHSTNDTGETVDDGSSKPKPKSPKPKEVPASKPVPVAPAVPEYPGASKVVIHDTEKLPPDVPTVPCFKPKPPKPPKPVEVKAQKSKSTTGENKLIAEGPPLPPPPPPPKSKDYSSATTDETIHGDQQGRNAFFQGSEEKVGTSKPTKLAKETKMVQSQPTAPLPPEYPAVVNINIHTGVGGPVDIEVPQTSKPKKKEQVKSSVPKSTSTTTGPEYPYAQNIDIHGGGMPKEK